MALGHGERYALQMPMVLMKEVPVLKKIVHFCVPQIYEGDVTYFVSFTLSQEDA